MREKKQGETILSLFFLGFFVILTIISLTYSSKARRLPLIVGIPGVALAAVEVYRRTIKRSTPEPEPAESPDEKETEEEGQGLTDDPKKVAGMIGWVVLLVGMIWVFGFLVTIPAYTMLFMKVRRESWTASLLFAGIGFAALYGLFIFALNIELYPGLIFR